MNDRGEVVAEVLQDDGRIDRERIREREKMSNVRIQRGWDTDREMNGAESRKIGQGTGSE